MIEQEQRGLRVLEGIPVWGPADPGAMEQIKRCARTADRVALMADHHKGYAVPIGGIVAYRNGISPSGVGYDIGCGNKAVLTDMPGAEARQNIVKIMDDIQSNLSFGVGRKNAEPVDHVLFEDPAWIEIRSLNLYDKARAQLGTIGSGNHYVDVFYDEQDRTWVGVHFGSRGLGHGIANWALKAGGAVDAMDADPLVLDEGSLLFDSYLQAMTLAGAYAHAGRNWVCSKVVTDILGAKVLDEVHNHHNFAWREFHYSEWLWVVRKGATPAGPGQQCFVGGTMGDNAVILEGLPQPSLNGALEQQASLYSTVHGAGRAMSRTAAAGKVKRGKTVKQGRIAEEFGIKDGWELTAWLKEKRGVVLRGAGLDEAPMAYKSLREVLTHHENTVKILHTLVPIGVAMAPPHERDPYKD